MNNPLELLKKALLRSVEDCLCCAAKDIFINQAIAALEADRSEFTKKARKIVETTKEAYPNGWSSSNGHTLIVTPTNTLSEACDLIDRLMAEKRLSK